MQKQQQSVKTTEREGGRADTTLNGTVAVQHMQQPAEAEQEMKNKTNTATLLHFICPYKTMHAYLPVS